MTSLVACVLILVVTVLLTVVLFTLTERQVMASMQRRVGPNVSGPYGLVQSVYDGLKLGLKEYVLPSLSVTGAFVVAPIVSFVLSQVAYCALFLSDGTYMGLVLMAISSLGVYGVVLSGWASNSKYALLGCVRSVSLMVSYELGFGAMLLCISLFLVDPCGLKSLNLYVPNRGILWALLPILLVFLVCILAETKRTPFDLPEAEAELVAGYNVEYSSLAFALFFISEYANMAAMSILASMYFLGGYSVVVLVGVYFGFIWVRATLPRYRYDQFLRLGWKSLLPLSLSLYSIYAVFDYVA
jgi:NADH:ubiquinone oxidoreductase subunit H